MPQLLVLDLRSNMKLDGKALSKLSSLNDLKQLMISECGIVDQEITELSCGF